MTLVLEVLGHAPLALMAAILALGAAMAIDPGPTLRRIAGLVAMGAGGATLVATLTAPVLGGERFGLLALALMVAVAALAVAIGVRLHETESAEAGGD